MVKIVGYVIRISTWIVRAIIWKDVETIQINNRSQYIFQKMALINIKNMRFM